MLHVNFFVFRCLETCAADIAIELIAEAELIKTGKKLINQLTSWTIFNCLSLRIALTAPLLTIFNLALKTVNFPILWKVSKECRISKSGERDHKLQINI